MTPHHRVLRAILHASHLHLGGRVLCLDHAEAKTRLAAGIELFRRRGWPLHGFVAPAWLMSAGTRQALGESGLRYTSDPSNLYLLPHLQPIEAPGLV